MKIVTITKYTTSDGKTFESKKAAQAHELRLFFTPDGDDARLTASAILDKIVADPEGVMVKIEEVMGAEAA